MPRCPHDLPHTFRVNAHGSWHIDIDGIDVNIDIGIDIELSALCDTPPPCLVVIAVRDRHARHRLVILVAPRPQHVEIYNQHSRVEPRRPRVPDPLPHRRRIRPDVCARRVIDQFVAAQVDIESSV